MKITLCNIAELRCAARQVCALKLAAGLRSQSMAGLSSERSSTAAHSLMLYAKPASF